MDHDLIGAWSERIRAAAAAGTPLVVRGAGSKHFYGNPVRGERLDASAYAGIVDYEPTELVLTARAGTPLARVEAALAEQDQMLGFEPPRFGGAGTIGGAVAAGLSGPRRAAAGSARDFVLGVRLIDGRGRVLRFGGRVMKNVAGYDVSRLMCGALGTLGLLLDVSLKVVPRPAAECTLRFELSQTEALRRMHEWAGRPYPISATSHHDGVLAVRLSGAPSAVRETAARLGGEADPAGDGYWRALRDQQTAFFEDSARLWRLSVKSTTAPLEIDGDHWIEWNGALRWLRSDAGAQIVRAAAERARGHATLWRGATADESVFHPLPPALFALHRRLKQAFDPAGIFNRGRMYSDL